MGEGSLSSRTTKELTPPRRLLPKRSEQVFGECSEAPALQQSSLMSSALWYVQRTTHTWRFTLRAQASYPSPRDYGEDSRSPDMTHRLLLHTRQVRTEKRPKRVQKNTKPRLFGDSVGTSRIGFIVPWEQPWHCCN